MISLSEMDFLGFAMKNVVVLAWPLLSLGYPLCASVRAIERNSNLDMQKLITYWILYSLISLLELGISEFITWIPFWPYIKLMAICLLVLPRFDGAYRVYESLIHPCFRLNSLNVIDRFKQPMDISHYPEENFLAMAQRYVAENGSEALEKLIVSKSMDVKHSGVVEEMNAAAKKEREEAASATQGKSGEPVQVYVEREALVDLEIEEMTAASTVSEETKLPEKGTDKKDEEGKCNDFAAAQKDLKAVEPASTLSREGPNLTCVESKTDAAPAVKEATAASVSGEEMKLPETKRVQKEWTCAVCQLTVQSEKVLNSHLAGRKHKDNCERLKMGKQIEKKSMKQVKSNEANKEQEERGLGSESKHEDQKSSAEKPEQPKYWCSVCGVSCSSEIDLMCHFNGRKHRSKIQAMTRDVRSTDT